MKKNTKSKIRDAEITEIIKRKKLHSKVQKRTRNSEIEKKN